MLSLQFHSYFGSCVQITFLPSKVKDHFQESSIFLSSSKSSHSPVCSNFVLSLFFEDFYSYFQLGFLHLFFVRVCYCCQQGFLGCFFYRDFYYYYYYWFFGQFSIKVFYSWGFFTIIFCWKLLVLFLGISTRVFFAIVFIRVFLQLSFIMF